MAMDLLKFSNELADTVTRASASVVAVHGRRGVGSSGVVWRDNLILTSSESIRAEEGIQIALPDGRVTNGRLRGRDSGTDLALLEIEAQGLAPLQFAAESALRPGQFTLAVGRTSNTGPIASFGIISGVSGEWKTWSGGKIDPFVRLDITHYPTLSGGAALDASGNLIGLISTGLSRSSVFAVTRATIERVGDHLSRRGFVSRGFLGVAMQPVTLPQELQHQLSQQTGIMLIGIEPDGPAAQAKLMLGDVLVAAEAKQTAQSLTRPESLADFLDHTPAGETAKFRVVRAGELRDVEVSVGERPSRRR